MKKNRPISSNIEMENRKELSNQPVRVPMSKLISGSVENKHPVILDDGRTIIYIADKQRKREIKLRYKMKKVYFSSFL
jgi:hypothetical protein